VTAPSPSHDNDENDNDKDDEQYCTSNYYCDHCDIDAVAAAAAGRRDGCRRLAHVNDRHIKLLHSRSTSQPLTRSVGSHSCQYCVTLTANSTSLSSIICLVKTAKSIVKNLAVYNANDDIRKLADLKQ